MPKVWHTGVQVERIGPTTIRFTCPRGHQTVHDYSKGPPARRISAAGLTLLLGGWRDRVTHRCERCRPD